MLFPGRGERLRDSGLGRCRRGEGPAWNDPRAWRTAPALTGARPSSDVRVSRTQMKRKDADRGLTGPTRCAAGAWYGRDSAKDPAWRAGGDGYAIGQVKGSLTRT
ncbi:hypothetical protein GCM10009736_49820 [Actinomadura bangladeshensis]